MIANDIYSNGLDQMNTFILFCNICFTFTKKKKKIEKEIDLCIFKVSYQTANDCHVVSIAIC